MTSVQKPFRAPFEGAWNGRPVQLMLEGLRHGKARALIHRHSASSVVSRFLIAAMKISPSATPTPQRLSARARQLPPLKRPEAAVWRAQPSQPPVATEAAVLQRLVEALN